MVEGSYLQDILKETAAIEVAKHHNAKITAVCSSKGYTLVAELRVNRIVLYDKKGFTKQTEKFDILFYVVGIYSNNLLNKNGVYKSVYSVCAS